MPPLATVVLMSTCTAVPAFSAASDAATSAAADPGAVVLAVGEPAGALPAPGLAAAGAELVGAAGALDEAVGAAAGWLLVQPAANATTPAVTSAHAPSDRFTVPC